jgi:CDP-diglyceride synthetase
MIELKLLLLIIIANGVPVLARNVFNERLNTPLDFNQKFVDGRPWFGEAKTLRGLVASIVVTALAAVALDLRLMLGVVIACLAMFGDLISSFIKRRFNIKPSDRALGLDQIPESLFPMIACQIMLGLDWKTVLGVVGLFFFAELFLSRILYHLHIRKKPF